MPRSGGGGCCCLWLVLTAMPWQSVDHLESHNRQITKVEFNQLDPQIFVAGTMGGVIFQWDMRTKQQIDKPINSKQPIRNVSLPRDPQCRALTLDRSSLAGLLPSRPVPSRLSQ